MTTPNQIKFTRGMCVKKGDVAVIDAAEYEGICRMMEAYEVIPDDVPIKLYYDIDIKGDANTYDGQMEWCEDVISYAIYGITTQIKEKMGVETELDFVVATSNSECVEDWKTKTEYWKLSIHIIVNNVVCMKADQLPLVKKINEFMRSGAAKIDGVNIARDVGNMVGKDELGKINGLFDESIYDTARKFRSIHVSKPNEYRPLVLVKGTFEKSLISAFIPEDAVVIKEQMKENKPKVAAVAVAPTEKGGDDYNSEKFDGFLEAGLFDDRAREYKPWLDMGFALFNEFGNSIGWELFDKFSQRATNNKYDGDKNREIWDKLTESLQGDKKLKFGSIVKWARDADRDQADDIIKSVNAERRKTVGKAKKAAEGGEDKEGCDKVFERIYPEFEKAHAKIKNRGCYVKELNDEVIVFSKSMLVNAYEHIQCGFNSMGHPVLFINYWTQFNDKIRIYEDMNIYPDETKCPQNVFNLWRPFQINLFKGEYTPNTDAVKTVFNHIKILCNHQDAVYQYILLWIAHMLQFPAKKSIVPTFISKQGAGKGTLMKLMGKLLGEKRVLETTTPSRDVWGNFNGMMPTKFLINLNELSRKETTESEGRIKALITDPTLTINSKGVNQYEIQSYHRFIITTNNEQPVATSDDDRRNLIIRCSDELLRNNEYFLKMHSLLEEEEVIRSVGDAFKAMKVKQNFNEYSIPKTKYQDDLKEASRPYYELWLAGFVAEHHNLQEVNLYPSEMFASFKHWCDRNGYAIDNMNSTRLGVRVNNLFPPTDREKYIITANNGKHRKTIFIPALIEFFGVETEVEV
jgi:hypothetical protein